MRTMDAGSDNDVANRHGIFHRDHIVPRRPLQNAAGVMPMNTDAQTSGLTLVERLREPIIADALADGRIQSGILAERLINERCEAAEALASPAAGPVPETADVHCFGRVDGTGELHPEGSYVSLVTVSKSGERRVHRVSLGAADNLIAELQAAFYRPPMDISELIRMARAAQHDERLSDGALYGRLADALAHPAPAPANAGGQAADERLADARKAALEEAAQWHEGEADRIRGLSRWDGRDAKFIEAIGDHEEAAASIRALALSPAPQGGPAWGPWRPKDTAPKDGTHFLAADFTRGAVGFGYFKGHTMAQPVMTVVHFAEDAEFYTSVNELEPQKPFYFTDWQPLPDKRQTP